jgi:hypothetical protein
MMLYNAHASQSKGIPLTDSSVASFFHVKPSSSTSPATTAIVAEHLRSQFGKFGLNDTPNEINDALSIIIKISIPSEFPDGSWWPYFFASVPSHLQSL